MKPDSYFIKDLQEYKNIERQLERVMNLANRMPDQVFHVEYHNYLFEDFDWTMSGDFGNELQRLSRNTNDEFVIVAVLDPHPLNYYFKEFKYFNWAVMPSNILSDQYWDLLNVEPEGSPADSILSNSFTVVWMGSSMKWAIWGDRSYGISILVHKECKEHNNLSLDSWHPLDDTVIKSWVENNFKNQIVPNDIRERLYSNYSTRN